MAVADVIQLAGGKCQKFNGRPIRFTRKCEENLRGRELFIRTGDRLRHQGAKGCKRVAPFHSQRVQRAPHLRFLVIALDTVLADLFDPLTELGPKILAQSNQVLVG